jgi:uncharacterized repeat protein (TIGR03803 family)
MICLMAIQRHALTVRGTLLAVFLIFSTYAPAQPVLTTLHSFRGGPSDGNGPSSGVAISSGGVLYGSTISGGAGTGTVFSLSPPAVPGGSWIEASYKFPKL